jgi:hypothetical protein
MPLMVRGARMGFRRWFSLGFSIFSMYVVVEWEKASVKQARTVPFCPGLLSKILCHMNEERKMFLLVESYM